MASYIYMQNLNEISQIIFSILYVKIKTRGSEVPQKAGCARRKQG